MQTNKRKSSIGWTLGLGLVAATVYFGGPALLKFAKSDTLSAYRSGSGALDPDKSTTFLRDVDFSHYDGDRLVTRGHVREMDITQSRERVTMRGIDKGEYLGEKNQVIRFEAPVGVWNQMAKMLSLSQGVRLFSGDFDLKTASALFESSRELLRIPGQIAGKFFKGDLKAQRLLYHIPTKTYQLGPVEWVGMLQEDDKSLKRTRWTIKADGATRGAGDTEVWTTAQATDGDVIVRADRIERNVKTDVLVATGNVRYYSRETNMTCKKATVYRKQKRAVLEGEVSMLVKPQDAQKLEVVEIPPLRPIVPDSIASSRPSAARTEEERTADDEVRSGSNRRKYPIQIYASKVDYNYARGSRRAVITGSPQARQELPGGRWRAAWCSEAIYDRERETLEMKSGDQRVRIKTSLGDDLTASWFKVSTRDGDDSYEAKSLAGEVSVEDEDLQDSPPATEPPPADGTTPRLRGPIGR
ncbi:MAG: hypothetical protein JNM85_03655 [Chthonomonas sp.]|nr:hypothetical protein [Chthonomonas sp.]